MKKTGLVWLLLMIVMAVLLSSSSLLRCRCSENEEDSSSEELIDEEPLIEMSYGSLFYTPHLPPKLQSFQGLFSVIWNTGKLLIISIVGAIQFSIKESHWGFYGFHAICTLIKHYLYANKLLWVASKLNQGFNIVWAIIGDLLLWIILFKVLPLFDFLLGSYQWVLYQVVIPFIQKHVIPTLYFFVLPNLKNLSKLLFRLFFWKYLKYQLLKNDKGIRVAFRKVKALPRNTWTFVKNFVYFSDIFLYLCYKYYELIRVSTSPREPLYIYTFLRQKVSHVYTSCNENFRMFWLFLGSYRVTRAATCVVIFTVVIMTIFGFEVLIDRVSKRPSYLVPCLYLLG